jgi:hypothetical protein
MSQTKTITCNCGRTVRCRPNSSGVVLCPRCKAAYTIGQFVRPAKQEEIIHDFTDAARRSS